MARIYCEETSSLYWEVYNEMNNNKKKFVSEAFKKRGRFSSSTKSPREFSKKALPETVGFFITITGNVS